MSDITVTSQESSSVDITVASSTGVTVSTPTVSSITVTEKGPKGDTGATGPQGLTGPQGAAGADGADGADGQGLITGGSENQFIQKNSATDYDTKWSAYTLPAADGDDGQVLTTDGAGAVSFGYPKTISENVKNVSGGTLTKGTPVHVTGSVGNLAEVIAADAATNYPAHFVLDQDLNDEGEGLGIALGFINNVNVPDASIYSEGQTVYLGASGGWTTTKPTGTNAIQNLGIIIKVNTGGNKISGIVMGAGRSNDVPNIPNGQAWIGNASGVATPTTLATVATSGSYSDLSGTPTIPSGDLVDDTTPQLGGDLDVNGNKITSASNGDITIDPDGTGAIILKSDDIQFDGGGVFQGKIKLYESDLLGSNFVALQAPLTLSADTTYTLPASPVSGYVLETNGVGTLSWVERLTKSNANHEGTFNLKPLSGGSDALLAFYDDAGDNYIVLRAPDVLTANTTFVLPASDGSADQVLKTDGSGNLSFVDQTTDTNTQNTTTLSFVDSSDDIILRNTTGGAGSGTQDININAGTNITLTHTDANNITIAASGGGGSANMENSKTSPTTVGAFNDGARLLTGHTSQAITAGNLVNLTGVGASNVGAQSAAVSATGMIFVATDAADSDELLVEGVVKLSTTTTTSLLPTTTKVGTPVYMSTTAGAVQTTAPSTAGEYVRVVGYVMNATDRVIYFKPDNTWLEL